MDETNEQGCIKNEIKELMIKAIKEERPVEIQHVCRKIWNQPFFFKIDKAKCITISYAPTDKGATKNYANIYEKYKHNKNSVTVEQIFHILYHFKKEVYWRKNYDIIFSTLNVKDDEIAHLDMSCFPYDKDKYRIQFSHLDITYQYPLNAINLIDNQLRYIFIDGKDNKEVITKFFLNDYVFLKSTKLQVNSSGRLSELTLYKHINKEILLIYFGTFLYGATCVSRKCVEEIASFIAINK